MCGVWGSFFGGDGSAIAVFDAATRRVAGLRTYISFFLSKLFPCFVLGHSNLLRLDLEMTVNLP
jgi:hypothetical protein